ncbi:MAG TPA: TPM domain-containing protein [Gemmatimonadaceae bacterium]|nr:TPM domain-containing protein [Gemmatimonadaceae bacterium]
MSLRSLALATALLVQVAPSPVQDRRLSWVRNPREANGSWVADPAHHLAKFNVQSIDAIIDKLEREKSIEMAVVVLDSLDGLDPADAALLLHRRWGVGKRQRDNGIVFLWSPALRKTYVSVGYGLEGVLPDARTGRILDEWVLPSFRAGNFDGGMLQGVQKLADAAREETAWRPERIAPGRATTAVKPSGGNSAWFLAPLGVVVLVGAGVTVGRYRRRRPRRCPAGHGKMRLLSESEDDAMLTREEGLEERLGSIDYDVWVCPKCDQRLVIPYRKWFSKYTDCPRCRRRTCETRSITMSVATTVSTGLRVVERECQNCGFKDSRREVIPMIVVTTSSSGGSDSSGGGGGGGGGGSSFGGGSAGGGGAGRSY